MSMWLLIALVVFVILYVIAPIRAKSSNRISMRDGYEPTRLEQLTPEMQQFVGQNVNGLVTAGFDVVANLARPGALSGFCAFQVLLVHRQTRDQASLILVTRSGKPVSMGSLIRSHFADGTRMNTQAVPVPVVCPRNPLFDAADFPWVRSPAALWEAHRRRLSRSGRENEPRVAPSPREAVAYLEEQTRQHLEWEIQCGYRCCCPTAGEYPLTWKGAYLSTWKVTPPIRQLRNWVRNRKARRLWRELEMGEWQPSACAM